MLHNLDPIPHPFFRTTLLFPFRRHLAQPRLLFLTLPDVSSGFVPVHQQSGGLYPFRRLGRPFCF
jgi:hypothetical protein